MQINLTPFRPEAPEIDMDDRFAERSSVARVAPQKGPAAAAQPVDDGAAEPESAPLSPPAAAVPWMDPQLGGRAGIGSPADYLPLLMDIHDQLSSRQDVVARYGSAAIMDEVRNHHILNAYLNSLIA